MRSARVLPPAAQLWPRVQAAAEEITKRELQPLLDASKPLWVNEIRITQCASTTARAKAGSG